MNRPIVQICTGTKDLINLIDATMVEIVLYARGETMIYADDVELKTQLTIQPQKLKESISKLDAMIQQTDDYLKSLKPPENVNGQILTIAEVIADKVDQFNAAEPGQFNNFFNSLPIASRHDLMQRLRTYRDYVFRAAGIDRAESGDADFSTEPPARIGGSR